MVSQVLFGESYRVIEKVDTWYKVRLDFDRYEGWISPTQINFVTEEEYFRLTGAETSVTLDLVQLLSCETARSMIPLVIGSSLPAFDESRIRIGQEVFLYEGTVSETVLNGTTAMYGKRLVNKVQLIEDAMLYLNAPYLWGGRTPFGIDCSGFIQMAYKLQGMNLLRDASQQATQGEVISLLAEAEPGDLIFFDDQEGNITHVGMMVDQQRIIHCSGKVRMDSLDHEGIYNEQVQRYTHKLRLIKRIS
jgi:hypothetical protein